MNIVELVAWLNWPKRLRSAESLCEFYHASFMELSEVAAQTRQTMWKTVELKDKALESLNAQLADGVIARASLIDANVKLAHQVEAERAKTASLREEVAILQGKLKRAGKSVAFATGKAKRSKKAAKKPVAK